MLGLMFLATIGFFGFWFAWFYFVTPQKDLERIKADQGGTGALGFTIRRIGTKFFGGKDFWVGDRMLSIPGIGPCRVYQVTVERAAGASDSYSIAVEARVFGLSNVVRIDPRAGE